MSKITKTELGKIGEDKATLYLQGQGYQILCRNYRYRKAEIDIIAQFKNLLVFVEVKARKNDLFGHPESFVDSFKIKLILSAARHYIGVLDWKNDIRFDIISITGNELVHFEDAFY